MSAKAELTVAAAMERAAEGPYRRLLLECIRLTRESYLAPAGPFRYPWLDIGPGYHNHPCFGHWDLIHDCFNLLPYAPEIVRQQMEMYLSFIDDCGQMPGTVWGPRAPSRGDTWDPNEWYEQEGFHWSKQHSHPPLWPALIDDYFEATGDRQFLTFCLDKGLKNLVWWRRERRAPEGGFYYLDILIREWESGVDDGVRFINVPTGPRPCIDATCHLASMMKSLQRWADTLGRHDVDLKNEISQCETLVRDAMWDDRTGFFYDLWMTKGDIRKIKSFEGFFPLVCGVATPKQAARLQEHLLDPREFFTYHPVATVAADEPEFKFDCWRGPAWNSMTFWIIRGLLCYGMTEAAKMIGQRALERSQEALERYGCLFEFYNSVGPDPTILGRKGDPSGPCRNYLGHAPFLAMYAYLSAD